MHTKILRIYKKHPENRTKTRPRKLRRRAKMGDADDEKEYIARAG